MLVEVESSKSITYYAAWAVANDVAEAPLAAAMAKAYSSDAYRHTAGEGIQIHGGIGFTWEHDMHIYFKRAKSSEVTFGDATWNREIVAQLINSVGRSDGRDRSQSARGVGAGVHDEGRAREDPRVREGGEGPEPGVPRRGDGALAPPTFLMTIAHWIGDLGETRQAVKLDYRRLLHGEQEFEYVKPIRAGDVLTFRSRTKDVFEKEGKRGGTMMFVIGETEFTNQRGEVVAYMRNTAIETADAVKG